MGLHSEIIEKILGEVDGDIREIMMRTESYNDGTTYKGHQLIQNPGLVILHWQELRDRKHQ